jgi:ribosome biogenesis protein NSA1
VIASCGLDRYLRVYDVKTRQLISAVFLKQHLTGLVFDSGFSGEETAVANTVAEAATEEKMTIMDQEDDETEKAPVKRKKSKKEKRSREIVFEGEDDEENEDEIEKAPVKTKKSKKEKRSREKVSEGEEKDELRSKKTREHKKKTKIVKHNQED